MIVEAYQGYLLQLNQTQNKIDQGNHVIVEYHGSLSASFYIFEIIGFGS